MKRIYTVLIALLLSVIVLAGCGASGEKETNQSQQGTKTEQTEKAAFPVTIKDATGEEVVIQAKPEKIVSLIPSNTEIAFSLGLGKEIVGVSDNDNYPEEVANIEKIGGMEFNVEKIISLQPDVVLAQGSMANSSAEGLKQLRDAGISVIVVNDAKTFAEVYKSIEMIGTATGKQEEAQKIVDDMKAKVEDLKAKAATIKDEDKKSVLMEITPAPELYAAGKNTFMDEMLTIINAENVVKENDWPKVDQEAIIASNPDVIITTYGFYVDDPVGQVTSREGWQDVNAVKNKRVVDVHSDKVTRPGPRLVEGVEEVAKAVYPDIFNK